MQLEQGEAIVCQAEDGLPKVDVQLLDEAVWLSQAQMMEVFNCNKKIIPEHIRNVFKEGELCE